MGQLNANCVCYLKKNLQVTYFGQSTHQPRKNSKFSMIIYFLNIHNSFFSLTVLQSLLPWGNQRFSLWCKRLLPLWKRCCVYKVNHTANHHVPLPVLQQDGSEGMEQGHHRHPSSHTEFPLISGDTLRPMGHITKFGHQHQSMLGWQFIRDWELKNPEFQEIFGSGQTGTFGPPPPHTFHTRRFSFSHKLVVSFCAPLDCLMWSLRHIHPTLELEWKILACWSCPWRLPWGLLEGSRLWPAERCHSCSKSVLIREHQNDVGEKEQW